MKRYSLTVFLPIGSLPNYCSKVVFKGLILLEELSLPRMFLLELKVLPYPGRLFALLLLFGLISFHSTNTPSLTFLDFSKHNALLRPKSASSDSFSENESLSSDS